MNRAERRRAERDERQEQRQTLRDQHRHVARLPERLTLIAPDQQPPLPDSMLPKAAWQSRHYLVLLYDEPTPGYPGLKRLTVMRTRVTASGRFEDGLSWDELQAIKREVGFGDCYAVEVYPRDRDMVNEANQRHLWLLPEPLMIGWMR